MTDGDLLELVEFFEDRLNQIEKKIDCLQRDLTIQGFDLSSIKSDLSSILEAVEDVDTHLNQAEPCTGLDFEKAEPWEPTEPKEGGENNDQS